MTESRDAKPSLLLGAYSTLVWILVSGALLWLLWKYVPVYALLLAEADAELPLNVRIVIATSHSVVRYLPFAVLLGPPVGGLLLVAAIVAIRARGLRFLLRVVTPLFLGAALIEMGACGYVVKTMQFAESVRPRPFGDRFEPAAAFHFEGYLRCETVVSTNPGLAKSKLDLRDADTPSVEVSYGASGRRMPRIHDDAERSVFQLANEEPGSVDTLSLDKVNGTFARTWSGWSTGGKELRAGGQRGRCAVAAPDAQETQEGSSAPRDRASR
jgi:hypothetical protein